MIAIPYSPHFSDNLSRKTDRDALPCAICGKAVTKPRWWVHVHCGGSHFVTEDEAATLDPAADMYSFPLGNDCYRKHPELKPYVMREVTEGVAP